MRQDLQKLDKSKIWLASREVGTVITDIYSELDDDTKNLLKYKFYYRSFDITSDIAESVGSVLPQDAEFALSGARRSLFGVRSSLTYLQMNNQANISPESFLVVDRLIDLIDAQLAKVWDELDKLAENGKK